MLAMGKLVEVATEEVSGAIPPKGPSSAEIFDCNIGDGNGDEDKAGRVEPNAGKEVERGRAAVSGVKDVDTIEGNFVSKVGNAEPNCVGLEVSAVRDG